MRAHQPDDLASVEVQRTPATPAAPLRRLSSRTLSALSDDELRTRLWRAVQARMSASTTRVHDHAGLVCLQAIDELIRRRVPLWGIAGAHRPATRARQPWVDPGRATTVVLKAEHAPDTTDLRPVTGPGTARRTVGGRRLLEFVRQLDGRVAHPWVKDVIYGSGVDVQWRQTLTAESSRRPTSTGMSTAVGTAPTNSPPSAAPTTAPSAMARTKRPCRRRTVKVASRR